ncbi:hypothetical protein [Rhodococcus opacus]|uniref:hypothetical protein n=1 Tax=Rhodococcus opacus TaxID=37919 RepID=UPI00155AFB36|nr:hypothetical protein [Rhodococcus opacus]
MAFQLFPDIEPLELRGGETGPLFPFFVTPGAETIFIRSIALWQDDQPLVGNAPIFQLKAGTDGPLTSVVADAGSVYIKDGDGTIAGTANCERFPSDIYQIEVSNLAQNVDTWQVRIKNCESESLRFVWAVARTEPETRQPWMVLTSADAERSGGLTTILGMSSATKVTIRNWGTAPLKLNDEPGTPLAGEHSSAVLLSRPKEVAPHQVREIEIKCGEVLYREEFEHALDTNDTNPAHTTLRFQTLPGGTLGTPTASFCRYCTRCPAYQPTPNAPGVSCQRQQCGHSVAAHLTLPPDRSNGQMS